MVMPQGLQRRNILGERGREEGTDAVATRKVIL
jgi:hypothetical protein